MPEESNKTFFEKNREAYYRFSSCELGNQKDEMVYYMITKLANDKESMKKVLDEIKKMTGMDISLDAALFIRRLANLSQVLNSANENNVKKL